MKLFKLLFVGVLFLALILQKTTNATKLNNKRKDSKILRIVTAQDSNYLTPQDDKKNKNINSNNHKDNNNNNLLNFSNDEKEKSKFNKLFSKKSHINNKQLLSKLGLSKIRIPASHSRKRLAVESRHHARPDDSHMFIIKLPPNPYYYTNQIPIDTKNPFDDYGKNKVSLGFRSNGKPGKIYHWNIPALKKIVTNGGTSGNMISSRHKNTDISNIIDIKNIPTWLKPWENENETIEKSYRKDILLDSENKSLKKKSPTYYAPLKHHHNGLSSYKNNKNKNLQKYILPGNGKPKGFYVIEKSHKPAYYKELIP